MNAETATSGNVIAGLASFFLPGLGQLVQGRMLAAFIHFLLGCVLWIVFMGWLIHIWSAYSAATYKGEHIDSHM